MEQNTVNLLKEKVQSKEALKLLKDILLDLSLSGRYDVNFKENPKVMELGLTLKKCTRATKYLSFRGFSNFENRFQQLRLVNGLGRYIWSMTLDGVQIKHILEGQYDTIFDE